MTENRQIRLFKPSVGEEELIAVNRVFQRSWLGLGPEVGEFEKEFGDYIGAPGRTLAVNSGTAALDLALRVNRFSKGMKVLVNNLTFAASATAILSNDLVPVLVDCEPDNLSFDLDDAKLKVDDQTVAIIVVHYGGHPASMDKIMDFATSHNLIVIEDCAHCLGGDYQGKKLGTIGDIGCFSFEEKKGITTGDGGMIVARNVDVIDELRPYRWIGIDKDTWRRVEGYTEHGLEDDRHWHYEISVLGFKYNMNDLAAAIGRVQLKKLDIFNESKRKAICEYSLHVKGLKLIQPIFNYNENSGAYWMYGVKTPLRGKLIRHLKSQGIATGVHYMPLGLQPLFSEFNEPKMYSNQVWNELVTLPLYPGIDLGDIQYVCEALIQFDSKNRN